MIACHRNLQVRLYSFVAHTNLCRDIHRISKTTFIFDYRLHVWRALSVNLQNVATVAVRGAAEEARSAEGEAMRVVVDIIGSTVCWLSGQVGSWCPADF